MDRSIWDRRFISKIIKTKATQDYRDNLEYKVYIDSIIDTYESLRLLGWKKSSFFYGFVHAVDDMQIAGDRYDQMLGRARKKAELKKIEAVSNHVSSTSSESSTSAGGGETMFRRASKVSSIIPEDIEDQELTCEIKAKSKVKVENSLLSDFYLTIHSIQESCIDFFRNRDAPIAAGNNTNEAIQHDDEYLTDTSVAGHASTSS